MDDEEVQMPKKNKMKKKQRQKFKIITAVALFLMAGILLGGAYVLAKLNKMDRIDIPKEEIATNDLATETQEAMEGYTSIALFGLDNRSNGNFTTGNSDAIIVASINNATSEIKMASIYRDTYLDIGEDKFRKANAAYNSGGPKQAINMLNTNLDLNIEDYVSVDFNALVSVIDQLGGIEIELTDAEAGNLQGYIDEIAEMTGESNEGVSGAGLQTLNGVQATAYSRIRYTQGWDYKRTERQRLVIEKIFEKAKKADLVKLNSILDTVLEDVSTSMSNADLLGLAKDAAKYSMGESIGFPFEKQSGNVGSLGDMVIPLDLEANVLKLHQFLYESESYTPSAKVKELSQTIHDNTGL
jgi:LCP family protein required for cell wall assembly